MSSSTRQLKIIGFLETETASASILINGVEVFNGPLSPDQTGPMPPTMLVDLAFFSYNGQKEIDDNITVDITVTSGSASLGKVYVDRNQDPTAEPNWFYPNYSDSSALDDGRTNIRRNGKLESWPSDGGPRLPGGTAENPTWYGWTFRTDTDDTFSFDYLVLSLLPITP